MLDGTPATLTSHADQLKRRYDTLKSQPERTNCEAHWQEIAEVIAPRKLDFVGMRTPGQKAMNRVYDSTGIHSNDLLAAGLHGMATNPASKWFSLRIVGDKIQTPDGEININDSPDIQKYLAQVEEVMWHRIYQPGTNFTTALHETYLDLGSFGTSTMFVGQRDDGGLLFEPRALAECVISENAEGRVDTVFRKTRYTVRQMVQLAKTKQRPDGWELSDRIRTLYAEQKYEDPVYVIHAVYPRVERDPGKKDRSNMPWASCYFEHETAHMLEEDGFPEFPYLTPRWSKYAGEVYGRSPGMVALPDIKMLQAMMLTVIKAAQKAVDPPMWLRDDGIVGQTRTVPGGINYWKGNPRDGVFLMPVDTKGLPVTLEMMENLRNRIRTTFFVDVLQFTSDADMTATEVMQRTAERMRLLGPLIGRLEAELLGPMVERIFGILSRLNLLPPPPKEIEGAEFTVEYVSPIATAQKQMSTNGILQVMQMIGGTFGPEGAAMIAQKNLDPDKLFRWGWDLYNNNPDLLKDEEGLEQENQKAQAAQALQMAGPSADIMQKGAGAVKSIADAQASGGVDVAGLMAEMQKQISADPSKMKMMQDMMNGQAPAQQ